MVDEFNMNDTLDDELDALPFKENTEVTPPQEEICVTVTSIDYHTEDASFSIGMDTMFPSIGEPNPELRHTLLTERDAPDQHPITAIVGLEPRLQNLEKLDRVRSIDENLASYYLWNDNNVTNQDRNYYFVAFVDGSDHLAISSENVIGVTMQATDIGFIGNVVDAESNIVIDDYDEIDTYRYGLVCMCGRVKVRTVGIVSIGDYVIPANGGYAKKSDRKYGYKVIDTVRANGINYAIICLVPQVQSVYQVSKEIAVLENRLTADEYNITAAINTANEAIEQSQRTEINVTEKIIYVNGVADAARNEAQQATATAQTAGVTSEIAKQVAELARTTSEQISRKVTTDITDLEGSLKDLADSVEPLVTWQGEASHGTSYIIDHIQNDLATKTELNTVVTEVDEAMTGIQKNAKMIQSMATVERKYTVGPHSPSYNLTYANAKEMIPVGLVYAPTVSSYENTKDGGHNFHFLKGSSYEWNGDGWTPHYDNVAFSNTYITGSAQIKYWYTARDVSVDGVIYPANSLCLWKNDAWCVVANIRDYENFHVTSRLYQTADELGAEILNAQGDLVSLNARITNDESRIEAIAIQQGKDAQTMVMLAEQADENGARIDSLAQYNGNALMQRLPLDTTPTGKFYIDAPVWDEEEEKWIFESDYSTTPMSPSYQPLTDDEYYRFYTEADNVWVREKYKHTINITGIQQQVDANESKISLVVSNDGSGDKVNAASIVAAVNNDGSKIALTGNRISIKSDYFELTDNGDITATSGKIGGWTIGEYNLYTGEDTADNAPDTLLGTANIQKAVSVAGSGAKNDWRLKIANNFGVDKYGTLYGGDVKLTGDIDMSTGHVISWGSNDPTPQDIRETIIGPYEVFSRSIYTDYLKIYTELSTYPDDAFVVYDSDSTGTYKAFHLYTQRKEYDGGVFSAQLLQLGETHAPNRQVEYQQIVGTNLRIGSDDLDSHGLKTYTTMNGYLCMGRLNYGTVEPSGSGITGQIYFQIEGA